VPRPPVADALPTSTPDAPLSRGAVVVWRPTEGAGPTIAVDAGGQVPVSAVYLWIRRGSAEEGPAMQGAAHLLEHMLFKGAGDHGVSAAAARIEGLGGDLNAFTSYEQTVLHATVPSGQEAAIIDILTEMGFAPHLDPGELVTEKGVVIEELRAALDDPEDRLAEALRARAHAGHPYARPILGEEETVRGMEAAALAAHHRSHYRPDQVVLAVAGPVDAEDIRAAAEASLARFGPQAARAAWPRAAAVPEPGCFVLDGDFEERVVELAWPIPGLEHPELAALDLAAAALGDGESALLRRRLRDELEVAVDAWATLETDVDRGLFVVGAMARPGRASEVARELARAVEELRARGLPQGALRRARRGILLSRMTDRETVDGRAYRLAWVLAQLGSLDAEDLYEARLRAVRGTDVQAAALAWLAPGARVAGAVCSGEELDVDGLATALAAGERAAGERAGGLAVEVPAGPTGRPAGEDAIVERRLRCGLRVVVQADPRAELAAVSLVGVGGMIAEAADRAGQAGAWAAALTRGAGDFDAQEFSALVEARAGGMRAWRSRNTLGLEARFPGEELDLGLSLLARVLCRPRFDTDEVARVRDDLDHARQALAHDDPSGLSWELAWRALYGNHPWGRSGLGTPASTARLTPRSLRAYHQRCIVGKNLVLAVVGDVDPAEVTDELDRLLADLPPGAPVSPRPPQVDEHFRRRRWRRRAREQHHLVLGFPACGHGEAAAPAQRLLEGILSGQSGRLFLSLREERGLAYSVDAAAVEGLGGGAFFVAAAVDPERSDEALAAVRAELARLREERVSDDELARVKARVVDGAVLGMQRVVDRARLLAAAERYGPGARRYREHIEAPSAVSAEDVLALARRVLRPDRCVLAEVGPDRATVESPT